jgi:hemin uptake protein HemP
VECAFGIWKGKWGVLWRPLRVKQCNIPKLVEVTARLHNLCINRNVSNDMNDFVVADDVFWMRTCSEGVRLKYRKQGRPPPPAPHANAEVLYADAETVAAILTDVPTAQGMRLLRKQTAAAIAHHGTIRRMAPLPPRLQRVSAGMIDDDDFAAYQVGDLES